jgi:curved DNA-binding protein CbpA
MFTLYDLLDAEPKADKARLKAAFRKAAKATHPDVCPDDADAAWRFRQIGRAYEILTDDELRAAYDHVVAFEQRRRDDASILDSMLAKIMSGAVTAAVVASIVFGGYALSAHLSERNVATTARPPVQSTTRTDVALTPAVTHPIEPARPTSDPVPAAIAEAAVDDVAGREAALEPVPDRAQRDAKFIHLRGLLAYRYGEVGRAIANFDAAIRLDPGFERAYRDRAAAFAITGQFDRAAVDLAQAARIRNAQVAKRRARMVVAAARDAQRHQRPNAIEPVKLVRQAPKVPWPAGG